MPKRTNPLDSINVASPCSADWDEMIGNEQVRFCQHCSRHVHDLSKITRKDALRLVATSKGKLCLRYERRPDGSVLTANRARPVAQAKRRLSRIAAGAFGATLSLAANAAAQSAATPERSPLVKIQPAPVEQARRVRHLSPDGETASLVGKIIDPTEAAIPEAKITITNEENGRELSTVTDADGSYQFLDLEPGTYKLSAESTGFQTFQEEKIVVRAGSERHVNATLSIGAVSGVVVVAPRTALIRAVWDGDLAEVRSLLADGADPNIVDEVADTTALGEAVAAGNLELVQTLLNAGADANVRDGSGQTALMKLDDDATPEMLRALIDAGAKVNLKDGEGETALQVAAALERADILQVLIDAGAKVNSKNREGKTALMIAADEGYIENVRALLWAGADSNRKDTDGKTALAYARENQHEDIAALLIAYGATE